MEMNGKYTVMIGHIHGETLDQLRRILEETGKCAVTFATSNGTELLKHIREREPELVIISAVLESLGCLSVIKQMKDRRISSQIMVLTNRSGYIRERAELAGADLCLVEPYQSTTVAEHVCRLLDSQLSLKEADIQAAVRKIFLDIAAPANLKGYNYTMAGIVMLCRRPELITDRQATKVLYPAMGLSCGESQTGNVERGMRTFIEHIWTRGNLEMLEIYFGRQDRNRCKPTTSAFLSTLAAQVLLRLPRKKHREWNLAELAGDSDTQIST